MSTVICTGAEDKCYCASYLECPICSAKFETMDGVYVDSATLGDRVLVCPMHKGEQVSAKDEVRIQDSLRRAIDNKDGRVNQDTRILKMPEILAKAGYKFKKDW